MPTYQLECPKCGAQAEHISTVDERNSYTTAHCGVRMERVITPAHSMPDIAPYMAVSGDRAGKWITSRKEHREFLKRNRFVEVGNESVKPIKNDLRPKRGEIAEELKRVIPQVLRR